MRFPADIANKDNDADVNDVIDAHDDAAVGAGESVATLDRAHDGDVVDGEHHLHQLQDAEVKNEQLQGVTLEPRLLAAARWR